MRQHNALQFEINFGILERLNTIVLLGRHGDIVNMLPLAHMLKPTNWVVGAEFAKLFDGVSYVNPVEYMRGPNHFNEAVEYAKKNNLPNILPAQVYTNPDKGKLTGSYATEAWRLAGHLEKYGAQPLIFDKRNPEREAKLIDKVISKDKPTVLVATRSMSSPFPRVPELLKKLGELDAHIVDMGFVKADRIYDMIGLFDRASCLVSIDTLHLHLARASYCPVVAFLNDNWCGSIPPPQAQWVYRYDTGRCPVDGAVEDVKNILKRQQFKPDPVMAVDLFTPVDIARATWPNIPPKHTYSRYFRDGERELPFMKEVLKETMKGTTGNVIVWTNCDTGFTETGLRQIKEHSKKYEFGCCRRDPAHIGRECFWFRLEWLANNLDSMPDVVLAAPKCDLVIAKWLRGFFGITSTLESMKYDFAPVDLPPGIVHHEHHASSWLAYQDSPSAKHNEELWRKE